MDRRSLLAAGLLPVVHRPAKKAASKPAVPNDFTTFLDGLRAEAMRRGVSSATLDRALGGLQPNPRVIELDRKQPEFTLTWTQYRTRIVSDARIAKGRTLYQRNRKLLDEVAARYGVPPGIMMGIWGLESNYGGSTGGFNVIQALATLSWEGRRAAFFRSELLDALRILQNGDITPEQMTGSYAGAMGQTQFMPDSFLKYAVDWSGTGRRDIWGDLGCVFASTANYLAQEGWQAGLTWGRQVTVPPGLDENLAGREHRRPVAEWVAMGVQRRDLVQLPSVPQPAALILPGEGDAYLVYHPNFQAIRRYNPSDFYCISVGLLGDAVTA